MKPTGKRRAGREFAVQCLFQLDHNSTPFEEALPRILEFKKDDGSRLAPSGKALRLRLTIDAQGRIARVEIVTGDRSAEACLRAALAGLSSATVARGNPTGTVEITLRARF